MAKRRRHRTGSVIRVRRLKGLGELNKPDTWLGASGPPTLGGGVAALTTLGIRHLITPTSEMQRTMMKWAPLWGLGAGLLTSLLLSWTSGQPAGLSAASAAAGVSGAIMLSEALLRPKLAASYPEASAAMTPYGLGAAYQTYMMSGARTGAMVMEPHASRGYGAQGGSVGAIVPEYGTQGLGAYGDQVALQGGGNLGSVSPTAFGTPGFNVAGR